MTSYDSSILLHATENNQRIPEKVFTLSCEVDMCKPLPFDGVPQFHARPRLRAVQTVPAGQGEAVQVDPRLTPG